MRHPERDCRRARTNSAVVREVFADTRRQNYKRQQQQQQLAGFHSAEVTTRQSLVARYEIQSSSSHPSCGRSQGT